MDANQRQVEAALRRFPAQAVQESGEAMAFHPAFRVAEPAGEVLAR